MEKGFLGGKNTGTFHHGFRSLLAASASALTGRRIYNRSVESEASSQIILAENLVKVYEARSLAFCS
jgi:hypothetical protein